MPRPSIVAATIIAALTCLPVPALATAGMICDALDDSGASVEMNLPRSAGSPPNWVRVASPGGNFSTLSMDEDAVPLHVRQAFDDGRSFNIDLTNDASDDPAVRIRLLVAEEGDGPRLNIGYLHVVGNGIYPISCTEDE
jgi:hypothetical protein